MNRVSLDIQADNVRQFLLSLSLDRGGTVFESDGQAVACLMPLPPANGISEEPWSDVKNARRCELIERKYRGAPLSTGEIVELGRLQDAMLRFRRRIAPLPLEDARRLHQQLLAQGAAAEA